MKRLALPLIVLLAMAPAAAQQGGLATSALRNHDTNAPIDVDASRIEVRDQEKQALFTGDVHIRQGRMGLDAERVRVFYEKAGGQNLAIQRIDAEGSVRLTSPSERATSNYGVYDVQQRQLTLIGNVVLNRGDSVLRGQRLSIDLDSGRSTLDGAATGGTGGRVTGRFVVPDRRQAP